jgi:hypothetical protein
MTSSQFTQVSRQTSPESGSLLQYKRSLHWFLCPFATETNVWMFLAEIDFNSFHQRLRHLRWGETTFHFCLDTFNILNPPMILEKKLDKQKKMKNFELIMTMHFIPFNFPFYSNFFVLLKILNVTSHRAIFLKKVSFEFQTGYVFQHFGHTTKVSNKIYASLYRRIIKEYKFKTFTKNDQQTYHFLIDFGITSTFSWVLLQLMLTAGDL